MLVSTFWSIIQKCAVAVVGEEGANAAGVVAQGLDLTSPCLLGCDAALSDLSSTTNC